MTLTTPGKMDESKLINTFDKWITEREASVLNLGIDLPRE